MRPCHCNGRAMRNVANEFEIPSAQIILMRKRTKMTITSTSIPLVASRCANTFLRFLIHTAIYYSRRECPSFLFSNVWCKKNDRHVFLRFKNYVYASQFTQRKSCYSFSFVFVSPFLLGVAISSSEFSEFIVTMRSENSFFSDSISIFYKHADLYPCHGFALIWILAQIIAEFLLLRCRFSELRFTYRVSAGISYILILFLAFEHQNEFQKMNRLPLWFSDGWFK